MDVPFNAVRVLQPTRRIKLVLKTYGQRARACYQTNRGYRRRLALLTGFRLGCGSLIFLRKTLLSSFCRAWTFRLAPRVSMEKLLMAAGALSVRSARSQRAATFRRSSPGE